MLWCCWLFAEPVAKQTAAGLLRPTHQAGYGCGGLLSEWRSAKSRPAVKAKPLLVRSWQAGPPSAASCCEGAAWLVGHARVCLQGGLSCGGSTAGGGCRMVLQSWIIGWIIWALHCCLHLLCM